MAGRQGFELGASLLSNVVMACVFWFQALESQAVMSLRFVHCRPPESPRFSARRGDILETVLASCLGPHQEVRWTIDLPPAPKPNSDELSWFHTYLLRVHLPNSVSLTGLGLGYFSSVFR